MKQQALPLRESLDRRTYERRIKAIKHAPKGDKLRMEEHLRRDVTEALKRGVGE